MYNRSIGVELQRPFLATRSVLQLLQMKHFSLIFVLAVDGGIRRLRQRMVAYESLYFSVIASSTIVEQEELSKDAVIMVVVAVVGTRRKRHFGHFSSLLAVDGEIRGWRQEEVAREGPFVPNGTPSTIDRLVAAPKVGLSWSFRHDSLTTTAFCT